MIGLIGSTGLIGQVLSQHIQFDKTFNSANIESIVDYQFDIVYCSAPSGNRLLANQNPQQDSASIQKLINILAHARIQKFVLISTVDAVHASDTTYGSNRKLLEDFVKQQFADHHIVRLCGLISKHIKKNTLYDLKHSQYISDIKLDLKCHWYPLTNLVKDLSTIISNNIREENLVSELVSNREIVNKFYPDYIDSILPSTEFESYNLTCNNTDIFGQYLLTKQDIFNSMQDYINDN